MSEDESKRTSSIPVAPGAEFFALEVIPLDGVNLARSVSREWNSDKELGANSFARSDHTKTSPEYANKVQNDQETFGSSEIELFAQELVNYQCSMIKVERNLICNSKFAHSPPGLDLDHLKWLVFSNLQIVLILILFHRHVMKKKPNLCCTVSGRRNKVLLDLQFEGTVAQKWRARVKACGTASGGEVKF